MGSHFGEVLLTSDASNLRVYQPVVSASSISFIADRTWFIFYNNPIFTSMSMDLYTNSPNNTPEALFASSSNSWLKSDIITAANGVKSINFNFDHVNLKVGEKYHLLVRIAGYTGTNNSHIAWYKNFDPVYNAPLTSLGSIGSGCFHISAVIGADI
jgi:hypothetical protein